MSRAYEKGETQDFVKICVDAETKQIWVLRFLESEAMK